MSNRIKLYYLFHRQYQNSISQNLSVLYRTSSLIDQRRFYHQSQILLSQEPTSSSNAKKNSQNSSNNNSNLKPEIIKSSTTETSSISTNSSGINTNSNYVVRNRYFAPRDDEQNQLTHSYSLPDLMLECRAATPMKTAPL